METIGERRVVAGVAELQPATLRFAMDEARLLGAELEVVHCAGFVNYAARVIDQIYFENWREAADHVLRESEAFVRGHWAAPRSSFRMADRPPVEELQALSAQADTIVVGADSPLWFQRLLGPAVAQTLSLAATCPVVIVPEDAMPTEAAHGVVVGLEGTRPDDHLLRYAFEHADARSCELRVIHALPPDAWAGEIDAHHAMISEALAGWGEKFPDVHITCRFVDGPPPRVCARATRRAELLVVGRAHHPAGILRHERPMTTALLELAQGPVAVVPDPVHR